MTLNIAKSDIENIIEFIVALPVSTIKVLFHRHNLPLSGTKSELSKRIVKAYSEGLLTESNLVDFLDEIDGWGKQHIYLFKANKGQCEVAKKGIEFREKLKGNGLLKLLNNKKSLTLPELPTLSSITHNSHQLRMTWIEKRVWEVRNDENDVRQEGLILKAYKISTQRLIISFDWDFDSRIVCLSIQQLQSGEAYHDYFEVYRDKLLNYFDLHNFTPIDLKKVIISLEANPAVARARKIKYATVAGYNASFNSDKKSNGLADDPQVADARKALGDDVLGNFGNFYFLPNSILDKEMHVTLNADPNSRGGHINRIGIFRQCKEEEIRHILATIKAHSN